jgi:hypothetical protein
LVAISVALIGAGVGNAVNPKVIIRVQGPSDKPADNELLESKKIGDLVIAGKQPTWSVICCAGGANSPDDETCKFTGLPCSRQRSALMVGIRKAMAELIQSIAVGERST